MRESDLLRHIQERASGLSRFGQVVVGPGDDCAVIRAPGGNELLLTVDHLVEGRHVERFSAEPTIEELDRAARKAIARSLSDIAAMGGTPTAALATACLPAGFPQRSADDLFDRLHAWAMAWSCPIVGGDIATFPDSGSASRRDPVVLTTTVIGSPHTRRGAVLRSGARPGDAVYVTGVLGDSLATGWHATFEPRLVEARSLCDLAAGEVGGSRGIGPDSVVVPGAMMDLSDGLGRDGARLAAASGVRIIIDADLIPKRATCPNWRRACGDGEDYELLFAAPADVDLRAVSSATGTPITRIGVAMALDGDRPNPGCWVCERDGTLVNAGELGWDHRGVRDEV